MNNLLETTITTSNTIINNQPIDNTIVNTNANSNVDTNNSIVSAQDNIDNTLISGYSNIHQWSNLSKGFININHASNMEPKQIISNFRKNRNVKHETSLDHMFEPTLCDTYCAEDKCSSDCRRLNCWRQVNVDQAPMPKANDLSLSNELVLDNSELANNKINSNNLNSL